MTDESFNHELAQSQILDNPFRLEFGPKSDLLSDILKIGNEATVVLDFGSSKQKSGVSTAFEFAHGITASINTYLVVQGACNAIMTHGHSLKGQPLAKKVLSFIEGAGDESKAVKVPKSLANHVRRLSEGDRSELPLLEPVKKKPRPSTVGVKADVELLAAALVIASAGNASASAGSSQQLAVDEDVML